VILQLPGPSILHEKSNSVLLAYGPLQTPDGAKIPLRFEDDLWHLPVYATPKAGKARRQQHPATPVPTQLSANRFAVLEDCDTEPTRHVVPRAAHWSTEDISTSHESWGHPEHSKYDEILCHYPHLFPRDPKYRTEARKHCCPVYDLMKGARTYSKSKRMKAKGRKEKGGVTQPATRSTIRPHAEADAPTAIAQHGAASILSWS